MSIVPGVRIGVYEVLEFVGQGGMGAVYRARDTALGRLAALKVLPAEVANDETRVKRFEREAKALASLNHPNIAQVFSLESFQGSAAAAPAVRAIAMEFVEGHDLNSRVGRLSIHDALDLAAQIAAALDAAHDANIVHRDLKPANVRVTPAGVAKVLDFGIATSIAADASSRETATMMTEPGVSIGTPGYMSPEQLRGEVVDKRTDIWAFGCLLFEMLAGARAFGGASNADVAAATLEREPDWTALPLGTPASVVSLVGHCLQKDRSRRFRDIGDARLVLRDAMNGPPTPPGLRPVRTRAPTVLLAAGAALIAAFATWSLAPLRGAPAAGSVRFEIVTPSHHALNVATTTPTIAMSPDGQTIAYVDASVSSSGGALVVRAIDGLIPRVVTGVTRAREPFFSPDGQWLGYQGDRGLEKVPVGGGEPHVIVATSGTVRSAAWLGDGTIVFSTTDPATGLLRVSDQGGTPTVLTTPNHGANETDHLFPAALPGGRGILFTSIDSTGASAIAVIDLESRAVKALVSQAACARYATSGHLLYARDGTVYALRFDLQTLTVSGDPKAVVDRVLMGTSGCAYFSTSQTGALAYVPRDAGDGPPRILAWVDRHGAEFPLSAPARAYQEVRLSPDGARVAVSIGAEDRDVWVWDIEREALTRMTNDAAVDRNPVWMPDGRRVVFSSVRAGANNLYEQNADGSGLSRRITISEANQVPVSIARDGGYLLGNSTLLGPWNLFLLPLSASPAIAESLLELPGNENFPAISPNGRFVAYSSDEAGSTQVFVRPFPRAGDSRWQVSKESGSHPKWSSDGRELFYQDGSGRIVGVPVDSTAPELRVGTPAIVVSRAYAFKGEGSTSPFDVSADGGRFLVVKPTDGPVPGPRIVVWLDAPPR